MENNTFIRQNKHYPVEKSCRTPIRIRFDALFSQFGKKRSELTEFLGGDRARTSRVVNGQEIPNLSTRVKIASFFKNGRGIPIDSSVIWENPDLKCIEQEFNQQMKEIGINIRESEND